MSNDEIDDKKITNLNSIKLKKPNNSKLRNGFNSNIQKDSSLILKDYSTPNPLKNEKSLLEMEMRKTTQAKQGLMKNNKILNNLDSSNKINNKRSLINNLKIIQEKMTNAYNPNSKINLEPLHLNISRNDYYNRVTSLNQENSQKITEDVSRPNANKLILRPIEIMDCNKNLKHQNKPDGFNATNVINEMINHDTENNFNKSKSNKMNLSHYARLNNKAIHNSNSNSNLFGYNNFNQDNSILDGKNYITGKNFLNGEFYNNVNFNKNLKSFNDLLKNEKLREATVSNNTHLNASTSNENNQSPVCEKKTVDKFSKTSNFEFNIIENLDVINLNTDISLIEENLKMNKGEFIKKLKSLYDDFNNSQKIFRNNNSCIINNKSYYNTSMLDRDKNITRIETIFENHEVKLDEMILLNTNKSTRKLGNLKKMVHTPSLKEIPIVSKDFKLDLQEMLSKWRTDLNDNSHLINIYGENIDNGEKNYTVIYEYCRYGNLKTLIKNLNFFPENLLKIISFQVLIALDKYHKKTGNCYNCITPSNILFDSNFEVKLAINFENILKNNDYYNSNMKSIINETETPVNQKKINDELKNDFKESFFNENKMRQKLKKDWILISNKCNSEIDVDFIDNSIDILQDSKYYLNSSNFLPNIEMNNYNTNYEKLPLINKNDNFYQSQLYMNSNFNEKGNLKGNLRHKNLSQVNFVESGKDFYDKKPVAKNQKLNFNSVYQYNLKSENDLIEKIKNKDRENFLIHNSQNNNTNNKINTENKNFNETAFISQKNNKIKNNTLYLGNNNNHNSNQNEITYLNMNNNNSAGFKLNSSGENHYINANLANVKLDLYDLGLLLIYCLLGGFDLFDFSDYECKHTRSDNCCCLLHCYYKYESKSKNKIKLSDYFKKFNFSFNLDNFICSLTNYKLDKNLCIENFKEHLWLSDIKTKFSNNQKTIYEYKNSSDDKVKKDSRFTNYISKNLLIDVDEFLSLANDIDSKGSLINNNTIVKKYEKFFESYESVIPNSINYFKEYNIRNYNQILNRDENLDFICKELNIDKEYLDNKLKSIIDNYLLSNDYRDNKQKI